MVHESKSKNGKTKIAVVGILFKIGRPDPILSKVSCLSQLQLIELIKI